MFVDMGKLVNKGQCLGCQLVLIPRKFCHLEKTKFLRDSDSFKTHISNKPPGGLPRGTGANADRLV